MHSVHPRPARLLPGSLAACVLTLSLGGCGGGEEPKSTTTASTAAPAATPAAPTGSTASSTERAPAAVEPAAHHPATGSEDMGVVAEATGPIEYEEPAPDRPLVATFPSTAEPEVPRPAIEDLPSDDELLGRPLVINHKIVPFDELKKEVCLGVVGVTEIEQTKLGIFIDEEIQRQLKDGASKDQLEVGAEEEAAYLKELEEEIKREFPEGDVGMDDVLSGFGTNDPKERLRLQKKFEKVFLPDDPAKYPPITVESILKQPGGDAVLDHYKQSYAERHKDGESKPKNIAERSFDSAILQQLLDHLQEMAKVEKDPAPGVLYRVNGVDIRMEDVWNRIKPFVTTMEVRSAKQWIVNTTLLKEALVKAGAWLTDEEAEAAYHVHSDPYKESIFSQERLALVVKHFPSVERYKEYRRYYEAFKRMKLPEMTDEALAKQAEFRTNKVVGQVAVDVDVLLCSAFDFKTNRWKPDGWATAEKRMRDVIQLLVEEQQPWEVMVERYSDFYEPPTPVSQRAQADPNQPRKGRFRNFQRNNLLGQLGESEYGLFLNGGSSITDFIFFEQEVNSLGQPMRGPIGWYLPRLYRRTKPLQRVSGQEEKMKELVQEDYLLWNLNQYVQELIDENEVYGLEYPGIAASDK